MKDAIDVITAPAQAAGSPSLGELSDEDLDVVVGGLRRAINLTEEVATPAEMTSLAGCRSSESLLKPAPA